MKTFRIIFIVCTALFFPKMPKAKAQYYNPFNPYMTPQAMQRAYDYGYQLVNEFERQNKKAYKMGQGMGWVSAGYSSIASGDYEAALESFQKAYDDYDYIPALANIGMCYELGIGTDRDTDWADALYDQGASLNDISCTAALQRIKRTGHYPASYKATYLQKIRNNFRNNNGGYVPNISSGSSGGNNSSTYTTCRICGGTGVCTSCHGTGGEWRDTGYYTGSGNKSWINCPSCKGNKRCFNCHGTGRQ